MVEALQIWADDQYPVSYIDELIRNENQICKFLKLCDFLTPCPTPHPILNVEYIKRFSHLYWNVSLFSHIVIVRLKLRNTKCLYALKQNVCPKIKEKHSLYFTLFASCLYDEL